MSAAAEALRAALGPERVFDSPVDLLAYARDTSIVDPGRGAVVARPRSSEQVAEVLRIASAHELPVYPRGAGSMYAGGALPHAGGVVLDLAGMRQVLDVDLARGLVVVEPGVTFGELLAHLRPHGVTIGIVPSTGAAATVGGAVSAHALGTGSPRHQSMGDEVAGLEVVLADGTCLRTGSAAAREAGFFHRYCLGPDLTGLFIGADSTLGVITAVALWLHPLPEWRDTLCVGFADYPAAARYIEALQQREWTRDIWYGAGYDAMAVRGRLGEPQPQDGTAELPRLVLGLDLGTEADEGPRVRQRLLGLAGEHGGAECARFDQAYFHDLRRDQMFWYGFAGYFSRSRCAIVLGSMATGTLPAFLDRVQDWRERYPDFVWAAATVLCRRGLHGGLIVFYDEQRQWPDIQAAIGVATAELVALGCVPYKSGKLWGDTLRQLEPWHGVLGRIKQALDPAGLMGPGNLGLDPAGRLDSGPG